MKPASNSPEWLMLRQWNEERIAAWTDELSGLMCPVDRANQLRGMIAALKEQRTYVDPSPTPEIMEPNYRV